MSDLFAKFRAGNRSLKMQLALYFIPVAILPVLGISYYATRIYEESTAENVQRRASSEREAILSEVEGVEEELLAQLRRYAASPRLRQNVADKRLADLEETLSGFRQTGRVRIYSSEGAFLGEAQGENSPAPRVNYLSKEGLQTVKTSGETLERYFSASGEGMVLLMRSLLKDKTRLYGVVELEYLFGAKQLAAMRNRRGLEVVFLSRDLGSVATSFSLGKTESEHLIQPLKSPQPASKMTSLWLGDVRYSAFLSDLPGAGGRNRRWGYLGILVPMTQLDATSYQLRLNIIYITAFLALGFVLLIFVFSNRIVKPIEILVGAMKRVKLGSIEEIPPVESSYELDYLVRAFNDMIRNVGAAKRALELKLAELRTANEEIRLTQGTLVQSAKMISLGQLVAGVAHELNNPIGFIHSNMHHLADYLDRLKKIISEYQSLKAQLPPAAVSHISSVEKTLDLEFLLKDMGELTQSCLDGANRTKEIVLGLRTFSRMDQSTFQPADLHEGLRSTLKLLNPQLKNRITVHEDFGNLPKVECSLTQLNQVFMNLFSNAAGAIPSKGDIWVRTRQEGNWAVIEIEDSGTGMSPEVLEKIFDPFFTTKQVGQGTGLGLSIAYGLIEKHNGKISVKSRVGQGTCFTLHLPISQKIAQAG